MWSDWLASCGFDFQSVCPVMEKDKRLMGASWWERLRGKLGLVLMGGAMFSKSLIQFSVDGWGCVPSQFLTWGQTMVEVMKIMVTSFIRRSACTADLSAPNPHLLGRLLDIHGQVWISLLWRSLLLSSGSWWAQGFVCALQESVSQSCVSSGSSMVGLMLLTSSKRAYAIPRSAAPRAPAPVAVHCWPVPPQDTLTGRSGSSLWGFLVYTRFCWNLPSVWWVWALIKNMI